MREIISLEESARLELEGAAQRLAIAKWSLADFDAEHETDCLALAELLLSLTADGRRLKWFSVADEFAPECLAMEVERRMKARDVVAILTWLEAKRGAPGTIRTDNLRAGVQRTNGRAMAGNTEDRADVYCTAESLGEWTPR